MTMTRKQRIRLGMAIFAAICVGAALILFFIVRFVSHGISSHSERKAVEGAVTSFGGQMQKVSLLAPAEDLKSSMELAYAPYVARSTLDAWEADPTLAPGRTVSSPWPKDVVISSATKNPDGTYAVQGKVEEVTSVEEANGGVADAYQAAFALAKQADGTWKITDFERGPYVQ